MNTIKNSTIAGISKPNSSANILAKWFNKQAEKFESTRFGWTAILITAQSCLGSIDCMYILQHHASDIMLAFCAALTMGCNAIFIAQGPGKWCLFSFYLSMIVNNIFILLNIINWTLKPRLFITFLLKWAILLTIKMQ